jgi:hypothetical protein
MSSFVGLIKEANIKVVFASLDCLQSFITDRKEAFSPLVNMTFDVLIPRLGDTKVVKYMLLLDFYIIYPHLLVD